MLTDKEEGLSYNLLTSENITSWFTSADNLLYETVF